MEEYKLYIKLKPIQYWNVECIGWLYRYVDGDCRNLEEYFSIQLKAALKCKVEIACISKTVFTGQTNNNKHQLNKLYATKRGIYIECHAKESLQIKRVVKAILASPY